jgi:putative aldouronate transport system permease protein
MKLIFGFPMPIIFALLLNEIRNRYFKRAVQSISYFPHFLSWVVLNGIFVQLLSPTTGPSAAIFRYFGGTPIYWLGDPDYFRGILVITSIWKTVGWSSIVYLAAIVGVDPQLHEAAIVDGANRFKRIIHVTLPCITPTITIMFIFAAGNLIKDDFDQIFNMYNSAVMGVADVLSTYTYRTGMENFQFSIATAAGLFQNIIAFILVLLANYFAKRFSEYGIW